MAAPELDENENAHLRKLMLDALEARKFRSVNNMALQLGMQGTSLGAFLKRGGASKETAHKFAALTGRSYEEVLGHAPGRKKNPTPPQSFVSPEGSPLFRPTPKAAQGARLILREQKISDAVIDVAEEETFLTTQEAASKATLVAAAWRAAIFGSQGQIPLHPTQPSGSSPPAGTRRSRMRER